MRIYDEDDVQELNAEQWQLDLLSLNPRYTCWGPHEDYMWKEGGGWDSRVIVPTWPKFSFGLNDLNECVNFYFAVRRESTECEECGGNGYHKDSQHVVNSFYSHMNDRGESWRDKITESERLALVEAGRVPEDKTLEQINADQHGPGLSSHDGINRLILTEARLKRLGLPVHCDKCDGNGYVYTADVAHVSLVLWILHPRKGCSRGVEVSRVERHDLPAIMEWLRAAAKRNAERFAALEAA